MKTNLYKLSAILIAIGFIIVSIPYMVWKVQTIKLTYQLDSYNNTINNTNKEIIRLDRKLINYRNKSDETKYKLDNLYKKKVLSFKTTRVNAINIDKTQTPPINIDTSINNKLTNDFYMYLAGMVGTPYKWGQKFGDKVDCSGLFSRYAYQQGFITAHQARTKMSAKHIYDMGVKKDMLYTTRGDLIYFQKTRKHNYIAHIAIVLGNDEEKGIHILEAHPVGGVRRRRIKPTGDWMLTGGDGKQYHLVATDNFLTHMKTKFFYQGDFSVTSYIPKTDTIDINGGGESGRHTASGLPLRDEYAGLVSACPKKYNIGLDGKSYDKLYIEGYGVVECRDRGGLITMAGETNSRGNIAKYNHLDIFAGLNTAKIEWTKSTHRIYLIK